MLSGALTLALLLLMGTAGIYEIWVDQYYLGGGIWVLTTLFLLPPVSERLQDHFDFPSAVFLGVFLLGGLLGFVCLAAGL